MEDSTMSDLPILSGSDLDQLMALSNQLKTAEGMIPRSLINQPGKILAAILAGRELGVGPMASLRAFHVVEGKPVADYSFWISRMKAAGYKIEWPESSAERVTLRLTGPDGAVHVETWDKERATRAGLWNGKDNWKRYPETMLKARCVATAGRSFAAEVMSGCYTPDEAEEMKSATHTVVTSEPAAERPASGQAQLAAALAAPIVSPNQAEIDAEARGCADLAKRIGLSAEDLYGICEEMGFQRSRLREMPIGNLKQLRDKLEEIDAAHIADLERRAEDVA